MYGKRMLLSLAVGFSLAGCGTHVVPPSQDSVFVKGDSQYYSLSCLQSLSGDAAQSPQCAVSRGMIDRQRGLQSRADLASIAAGSGTAINSGYNQNQVAVYVLAYFLESAVCGFIFNGNTSSCFSYLGVTPLFPPNGACSVSLLNYPTTAPAPAGNTYCTERAGSGFTPAGNCAAQAQTLQSELATAQNGCAIDADCGGIPNPTGYCGQVAVYEAASGHLMTLIQQQSATYHQQCLAPQNVACNMVAIAQRCVSGKCR